jgi:hypothetical protein
MTKPRRRTVASASLCNFDLRHDARLPSFAAVTVIGIGQSLCCYDARLICECWRYDNRYSGGGAKREDGLNPSAGIVSG